MHHGSNNLDDVEGTRCLRVGQRNLKVGQRTREGDQRRQAVGALNLFSNAIGVRLWLLAIFHLLASVCIADMLVECGEISHRRPQRDHLSGRCAPDQGCTGECTPAAHRETRVGALLRSPRRLRGHVGPSARPPRPQPPGPARGRSPPWGSAGRCRRPASSMGSHHPVQGPQRRSARATSPGSSGGGGRGGGAALVGGTP